MYSIEEIGQITEGIIIQGESHLNITSVHFDSRLMKDKSLFIALTEGKRDGHQFLYSALKNGARAALISDPSWSRKPELEGLTLILVSDTLKAFQQLAKVYRDRLKIPVIAVTGSNGKTTTKDMIAHLLESKYRVFKTYKNFNNHIGVPLSLLQIRPHHEAAVLEMGMNNYGEIDLLASLARPNVAVITNVNDAHIEFFSSRENIAKAKGELLPHVQKKGYVLLNGNDPYVSKLKHLYSGEIIFYGINDDKKNNELTTTDSLHIKANNVKYSGVGTSFQVEFDGHTLNLEIPLFGHHNVSNLLPALWIAYKEGCTLEQISDAVKTLNISNMRFEVLKGADNSLIINDAYNASPASMKQSVLTFHEIFPHRKKVLILGDMYELGTLTDQLHAEVGEFLNDLFNRQFPEMLVTVGEHSAHLSSSYQGNKKHFTDKMEAAEFLSKYLGEGYALLFKASRGMKLEEIVEILRKEQLR